MMETQKQQLISSHFIEREIDVIAGKSRTWTKRQKNGIMKKANQFSMVQLNGLANLYEYISSQHGTRTESVVVIVDGRRLSIVYGVAVFLPDFHQCVLVLFVRWLTVCCPTSILKWTAHSVVSFLFCLANHPIKHWLFGITVLPTKFFYGFCKYRVIVRSNLNSIWVLFSCRAPKLKHTIWKWGWRQVDKTNITPNRSVSIPRISFECVLTGGNRNDGKT